MTHADAFLRDILANPDDDAPRLIFADWLEEQGDAGSVARAEFIRVQCALASGSLSLRRRATLVRREQQFLQEWGDEWTLPIHRLVHSGRFHRGFIDEVSMRSDRFNAHAGQLFRRAPIQRLRLVHPCRLPLSLSVWEPINVVSVADNENLRRLRFLSLHDNQLASRDVCALVVSEHLTNLRELVLSYNRIGDKGIRALAGSPLLGLLEYLDIASNDIGANSLRFLARALESLADSSEGLCLQRLILSDGDLSAAGRRVVADSPLLHRLVRWHS